MMRYLALLALCLVLASPAAAATIRYYEDPVYVPLAKEDPHPMADLMALAEQGDGRAQFILGDLYSKGKGGLAKNRVKARYWFETAARKGFSMSFIRLAAMSKRAKDHIAAYKWYTLSIDNGSRAQGRWSEKQRAKLLQDRKFSRDELRTAREAVNDWMKKRETELSEDREKARVAREKAEKQAETMKITGRSATSRKRPEEKFKFIKKETDYNE